MQKRTLTGEEIRLLITLASSSSFSDVAGTLEVTQSAVSRAVNRLEDHFGCCLFLRGKQGCRPTDAMRELLPKLRHTLRLLEELNSTGLKKPRAISGHIRVAGFRSAISILLPRTISGLMAQHRQLRVSLSAVPERNGGVQKTLTENKADFGVMTFRPPRSLRSVHLGSDPYVVVRRRGVKRQSPRECLVLWTERCSEVVPEILKAHNWAPLETVHVDNDLGVLAMIENGAGYSIMPRLAAEPLSSKLVHHSLSVPFSRDIWLCARPDVWESLVGRTFRSAVLRDAPRVLSEFAVKG